MSPLPITIVRSWIEYKNWAFMATISLLAACRGVNGPICLQWMQMKLLTGLIGEAAVHSIKTKLTWTRKEECLWRLTCWSKTVRL
jgi:hypothetical protein